MAKTLVTGASGFIGSHLARALAERGDELVLLLRRTPTIAHLEDLELRPRDGRHDRPPRGAPGA